MCFLLLNTFYSAYIQKFADNLEPLGLLQVIDFNVHGMGCN